MKNRFDIAIQFIDFHRFPLSIDKNHLIATDFYRFLSITLSSTPGTVTLASHTHIRSLIDILTKVFSQSFLYLLITFPGFSHLETLTSDCERISIFPTNFVGPGTLRNVVGDSVISIISIYFN